MPVVIKYFLSFSRSQKYATRSLRSLLADFYDLSNSRKYFNTPLAYYVVSMYVVADRNCLEGRKGCVKQLTNCSESGASLEGGARGL